MRPGPKFEVTLEMAVENLRTVAQRLGVSSLSLRQYEQHGSFSGSAIARRHGWAKLLRASGLTDAPNGRRRRPRKLCSQQCGRLSMTYPDWFLCRTCKRRMLRLNGAEEHALSL